MNNYKYVGKIVATHGIKGELRIISNIENKNEIFKVNSFIYFGDIYSKHLIKSYRVHKNYDMITIDNFDNINDVLQFINLKVYKNKKDLKNINFYDDLIGYEVRYNNNFLGIITEFDNTTVNLLYKVEGKKNFLFPAKGPFIKEIIHSKKIVILKNIGGLL